MIAAALLAFELGGCSSGLLDPAGPIGTSERIILLDTTAIMLAILVSAINGPNLSAAGFSVMTLAVAAVRRATAAFGGTALSRPDHKLPHPRRWIRAGAHHLSRHVDPAQPQAVID